MALTAALELKPIDDRAGKPKGLRLRKHGKRIVGCDFCFKLRTCRSRRSRAGVFLWLRILCHVVLCSQIRQWTTPSCQARISFHVA